MESALAKAYGNAQKWGQAFGLKLPNLPQQQSKIISPIPVNKVLPQARANIVSQQPTKPSIKPIAPVISKKPQVKGATTNVPAVEVIKANLDRGFKQYGSPPIATMSAELAQLGHEIAQRGGNPYLPAVLTIKETSGLKNPRSQELNNPVGIGPGIQYPNLKVAILGGGTGGVNGAPQKGLRGVLEQPTYDEYYKTGNLRDFFKHYTPEGDPNNPSYQKQIELTNQLLNMFEGI